MASKKERVIKRLLQKQKDLYKKQKWEYPTIHVGREMRLSSNVDSVVSTGIRSLDLSCAKAAPRTYGLPFGRQVEIFGNESIGKTTLLLQIAANTQRIGGLAYWIETEGGLELKYAQALGVDVKELMISQPDYAEQVFEEINSLLECLDNEEKIPITILWDSVAATQTEAEMEGDFADSHMASFGRFISQAMRKINTKLSKRKVLFCYSNQTRANIRTFGFGPALKTYGEGSIKFYTSIRLQLVPKERIKDKDGDVTGMKVIIKILKNKCMNTAFSEVGPINLTKGEGFCYGHGLIDALRMRGKIDEKTRGWLKLPTGKKYREKELITLIDEDSAMRSYCEEILFKKLNKKLLKKKATTGKKKMIKRKKK